MAVANTPTPLPKGEPDISKINTFTGRTVQVTKYLQPRGSVGSTILPPVEMPLPQILALMTSLPLQHGPGFYKFTVSDTGGTGDDVWLTKLGPEIQEAPVAINGVPVAGTAAPAVSEGVRHIGRGFTYDADLGVLTTPWGTAVNWRPGEQLPTPPVNGVNAPAATPWGGPNQQWGGFPVVDSADSTRVKALEAQIADQIRQREMDALRADVRRGQEETSKTIAALVDKLTTVLTAKPNGPDPEVQRRLDEADRRAERAEQRAEEERREAARRIEMQAQNEKFERGLREAMANKTDPMLPMLLQLMTSGQAAASESVKAIQAAAAQTAAASERGVTQLVASMAGNNIGPLQLVQLLQTAKSDSADAAKTIMETAKDALSMQKETLMGLIDATGQGNQPPWMGLASSALEKVSQIGVAMAERNAQQAQQLPPVQQMRPAQQQQPMRAYPVQQPQVGQMNGAAAPRPTIAPPAPTADRPGAQETGLRPEGTEYDAATDTFTVPDGREFAQSDVAMNGWRVVLARNVKRAQPAPMAAAPPIVPDEVIAPKPKRGRPKKSETSDVPAPATPTHYSHEELRDLDPKAMYEFMSMYNDEALFGTLVFPYVQQLRANPVAPEKVARHVLQAHGQIQGSGGPVPPAMELLEVGQLQVLVARLFPGAPPDYCDAVVVALGNAIEAEENDDDEPEGIEAQ